MYSLVLLGHPCMIHLILEPLDVDEIIQCEVSVQLQSKISMYLEELGTDGKDITCIQFS